MKINFLKRILVQVSFLLLCISIKANDVNQNILAFEKEFFVHCRSGGIRKTNLPNKIIIQNIGLYEVSVRFGFERDHVILSPRQTKTFACYKDAVIETQKRAIIYIYPYRVSSNSPPEGYNKNNALLDALTLGVNYIPNVSKGLNELISAFWPRNKQNVWEKIHNVVKIFLDDKSVYTVTTIIKNDLKNVENKLKGLLAKKKTSTISKDYMDLAGYLVDIEQKFIFKEPSTRDNLMSNFYILPLYSNLVTMKMHFLAVALAQPTEFKLSSNEIEIIKQFAKDTLYGSNSNGAINYVNTMKSDVLTKTYQTVYPGGLYNVFMNVHSHIAVHGLEMIPLWEMEYNSPGSNEQPYIDAVSYSKFYGWATPNLFQQAIHASTSVLTPRSLVERPQKLLSISFYMSRNKINVIGLKLNFENYHEFMGIEGQWDRQHFDLTTRIITKLRVYINDDFFGLQFTTSDKKVSTFGYNCKDVEFQDFQLEDHHIASLYFEIDEYQVEKSIAVSYLRNSKID